MDTISPPAGRIHQPFDRPSAGGLDRLSPAADAAGGGSRPPGERRVKSSTKSPVATLAPTPSPGYLKPMIRPCFHPAFPVRDRAQAIAFAR